MKNSNEETDRLAKLTPATLEKIETSAIISAEYERVDTSEKTSVHYFKNLTILTESERCIVKHKGSILGIATLSFIENIVTARNERFEAFLKS